MTKLDSLGLTQRQESTLDRRVRESVITEKGKAMTEKVDEAREKIGVSIFSTWEDGDFENLVRLMRKFANELNADASRAAKNLR